MSEQSSPPPGASAGVDAAPLSADVCCGCKSGIACPNCPESTDGTSPRVGSAEWYADRFEVAQAEIASLRSALAAERAAGERWREYAEHVEGCRECGELSWTRCGEGSTLRIAAVGSTIYTDCRAWDDVADHTCNLCGQRLGDHSAYDFACPAARALAADRETETTNQQENR